MVLASKAALPPFNTARRPKQTGLSFTTTSENSTPVLYTAYMLLFYLTLVFKSQCNLTVLGLCL